MISSIDFNSPIPYYIQVKSILKDQIEKGILSHGEQLPGEHQLCQMFSVSRTVIGHALSELEQEGLITRRRGKGTFVVELETYERLSQTFRGFYTEMKTRGHIPISKVLKQELTAADPIVSKNLNLKTGSPVYLFERLRLINNEPIVLTSTYFPSKLVPGFEKLDLSKRSLYEVLENEYGLVVSTGHRIIGATIANEYQAKLFEIRVGDPLIVLNNTSYSPDGTPLEYYFGLYRGDRFIFEVDIVRYSE